MTRRVYFSFHYENDISRAMIVRNSWVIEGQEVAGFNDQAEFEKVKRQDRKRIQNWIDTQLKGTSVTVVLIGSETLERDFVCYEIMQSLKKGNGLIGVYINKLKDLQGSTSRREDSHVIVGCNSDFEPLYFDEICDGIYDYVAEDGYKNLKLWIETAAIKHGK